MIHVQLRLWVISSSTQSLVYFISGSLRVIAFSSRYQRTLAELSVRSQRWLRRRQQKNSVNRWIHTRKWRVGETITQENVDWRKRSSSSSLICCSARVFTFATLSMSSTPSVLWAFTRLTDSQLPTVISIIHTGRFTLSMQDSAEITYTWSCHHECRIVVVRIAIDARRDRCFRYVCYLCGSKCPSPKVSISRTVSSVSCLTEHRTSRDTDHFFHVVSYRNHACLHVATFTPRAFVIFVETTSSCA